MSFREPSETKPIRGRATRNQAVARAWLWLEAGLSHLSSGLAARYSQNNTINKSLP